MWHKSPVSKIKQGWKHSKVALTERKKNIKILYKVCRTNGMMVNYISISSPSIPTGYVG